MVKSRKNGKERQNNNDEKKKSPKRVTLPDGRTFVARYRCVTRAHLPANLCLRHPYRQRAAPRGRRRQIVVQQGRGLRQQYFKVCRNGCQNTNCARTW